MKISVIMNGRAGRANRELLERKIKDALFRCELVFDEPPTIDEMQASVAARVTDGTDYLIVCGGDGTLNVAVQPLVHMRQLGHRLPPLCPIPVGTANDLAHELHVSSHINEAARMILEGEVKEVDVIEIASPARKVYMLTNGGLGVPAETAARANRFRTRVHSMAEAPRTSPLLRPLARAASRLIKISGDHIYEAILGGVLSSWDADSWAVEMELPHGHRFVTRAPFIMINNQRVLGGNFISGPLTLHNDGSFNILLIDSSNLLSLTRSLLRIRKGHIPDEKTCPSFETDRVRIRALGRPFTFFGDGEILHENVSELEIRCLHPGLPIVVRGS